MRDSKYVRGDIMYTDELFRNISWRKLNGGVVPDGYEVKLFVHTGLMIRKIITTNEKSHNLNN